jgi:hypothetical protein
VQFLTVFHIKHPDKIVCAVRAAQRHIHSGNPAKYILWIPGPKRPGCVWSIPGLIGASTCVHVCSGTADRMGALARRVYAVPGEHGRLKDGNSGFLYSLKFYADRPRADRHTAARLVDSRLDSYKHQCPCVFWYGRPYGLIGQAYMRCSR